MPTPPADARAYNRDAWDRAAASGDRWTRPVGPEVIAAARRGDWHIVLTNQKPVPRAWFPEPLGDVLCLAGGGGQQAPVLAAAGARVTTLDNSPAQLARDREVAQREGLELRTVEATMEDLSAFADASFDLVVNPASVMFTPDVRRVWREVARVLRPGGTLLSGFLNPFTYVFDREAEETRREMVVRHPLPYADRTHLTPAQLDEHVAQGRPLEWSHTLTDLLAGQTAAGLVLVDLYEDTFGDDVVFDAYFPGLLATRALKPRAPL